MACILSPFPPCAYRSVEPPHLENSIRGRLLCASPNAEPNPPHICQTPIPVYNYISEFPPDIFKEEEKFSEQKISFKSDGDGRDSNCAKGFVFIFHFWYYNPVSIFFL